MQKRKLQQFWILKFDSNRLKDYNYKIKLTLDEARKNNEVVSVGESQVIRSLFRLMGRDFNKEELKNLIKLKKQIQRKKNVQNNLFKINEIQTKIDNILFVPEIVSVKFANISHYKNVSKDGFFINDEKYVRLLSGAGNIRLNTVVFCKETISQKLFDVLENDRDKTVDIVPAKFNAYFALANSSTTEVEFPRICVIKDHFIKTTRNVDFITESSEKGDESVVKKNKKVEIELNSFDGQGLISPDFALRWSKEMGLDYIPASFIIRAPFIKGMVCTFPIEEFSETVAKDNTIIDIYGNKVNVYDVDVILSESQFKLWYGYKSTEDYLEKCRRNGLGFGVSRVSPKEDKSYATSNYQFLQILELDDNQIEAICKQTVDWADDLTGKDFRKMILYFMGKAVDNGFDVSEFKLLNDMTKALMLNGKVAEDKYVRQRFTNSINKKIYESYLGKLLFEGNYSFLISDPYAQAQHAFGNKVTGLLSDGQHYSDFWNKRNVKSVAACRPPLTYQSELNVLHFRNSRKMNRWYSFINSGIIIPAGGIGIDTVLFADADHDGDVVATFNSKEFIDGKKSGLPILYDKNVADKKIINGAGSKVLSRTDIDGFNCKVGYITNVASSLYCQLYGFEPGSKEYNEILSRIKRCRKFQGDSIDAGKGIKAKPLSEKFVKFQPNPENKKEIDFENSIVINKRPYYFRYLYNDYSKKYKRRFDNYNIHSIIKFGKEFVHMLDDDFSLLSEDEQKFVENYYQYSSFMFHPSTMNKICMNMEEKIKPIKQNYRNGNFDNSILKNKRFDVLDEDVSIMKDLYKRYKTYKTNMHHSNDTSYESLDHFIVSIVSEANEKISTNISELATLAVEVCYGENKNASSEFAWRCFGDGIIKNLYTNKRNKTILVPRKDSDGELEYLWNKYTMMEMDIDAENLL